MQALFFIYFFIEKVDGCIDYLQIITKLFWRDASQMFKNKNNNELPACQVPL